MNIDLHQYQQRAVDFLMQRLYVEAEAVSGAGLFLDPGLGKTGITLFLLERLKQLGEMQSTLIVAPMRVCQETWPAEIEKWQADLTYGLLTGTPRAKQRALDARPDVLLTNPEGIPWLAKAGLPGCFDTLVVDESTKFKNHGAKRHRAIRRLLPQFSRRVILTGTPHPNSIEDLHGQVYLLDDGETLGKTKTFFRNHFMRKGGFQGREWLMTEGADEVALNRIKHLVLRMDALDYLDMPKLVNNVIEVELPPRIASAYRQLEQQLFYELREGHDLVASSAGAAYAMCRGVANGGVYVAGEAGDRRAEHVHDAKVEAVVDLLEELSGKPLLVAYQFTHDRDRLLSHRALKGSPVICGGVKPAEVSAAVRGWNEGEVKTLLCQPQAMAHGLNLQKGGCDVAWLGLTDKLEEYLQLNARLYRQGQTKKQVRVHHILAKDTVDRVIYERLQRKDGVQRKLLDSLREYAKQTGFTV